MDSERIWATAPGASTEDTSVGDPRVDEAVAGLASLDERPLEEHPPVLEAVHARLREILGELGEPGRPGRPGTQAELGGQGTPGGQGR